MNMDYVKLFAKTATQRNSETDGLHEIHPKGHLHKRSILGRWLSNFDES